jgi:asparagine synthase (glutamine-hydrolysing)
VTRYFVALGDPKCAEHCAAISHIRHRMRIRDGWRTAIDLPYCHVSHLTSATDPSFVLPGNRGVILGSMFPTAVKGSAPLRFLTETACNRILDSAGRSLAEDYWGHFVAVLLDEDKQQSLVFRSPVSSIPCMHCRVGTLQLFFSHVGDCVSLNLLAFTINWDAITAQVMHADYLTSETGIDEIAALDGGECVMYAQKAHRTVRHWDPIKALAEPKFDDFDFVVDATRERVLQGVAELASPHSHLLVNLSGGLDSSIVLSALRRVAPGLTISAVNSYSSGTGDERPFARRMAKSAKCRLIELPRDVHLDLRCFDSINWTVQPVLNFSAPDSELRTAALARELGATAVVDGELGDNIFGSGPTTGALIECFRMHKFGPAFLRASVDFALLTRQSVWQVWRQTRVEHASLSTHPDLSSVLDLQRLYTAAGFSRMILASREAESHHRGMGSRFLHPWLQGTRRIAPSAHGLLFGLIVVTSSAYSSPFTGPSDPQRLSPLLAQPLMELMLRVPAYLHFLRGQNRAVARSAFADRLPVEILERGTGKGGPILWAKSVIENNAEFLREYFLDGMLVNRGLLDKEKIEAVFSNKIEKSTAVVGDVFAKIYIEAWLRKWRTVTAPHPAIAIR